jgi:hypothetical protein
MAMALEGNVKTPFGNVSKKTAVIVGGGGVLLLGIVWYRSKKNAGSSSTSSTDTTASTDQSNIDPATGFPYGSPEDVAALQQQQMIGGGFGPVFGGGTPGGSTTGPGPGSFTSNGQWAQYAEDYLVNTIGEPAADVGNALGKYVTAQPVDTTGKGYINQAIAFAGFPPVAGPNGNPPGIVDGPPGPPPGQQVTVPNVVGMETDAGQRAITAAGLKYSRTQKLKTGVGSTRVPLLGLRFLVALLFPLRLRKSTNGL